ncbi:hypothetical protein Bca52824_077917 [Brassica carinata]|uniref:RNase H type-1 domain-containing protein n=1 Tax=Brassica carinata TaxID=52824 RepID=A0A8X7PWW1_BRACI|nr:hypothetical protein Bca52824_077917 [Brassica carinata]
MREAVKKSKELGFRHIRCESDSADQLIKAINPDLYGIISDIRLDCIAFDSISFSWIPRLRNQDADVLDEQALSHIAVLATA